MKLFLSVVIALGSSISSAETWVNASYSSAYSTNIIKISESTCESSSMTSVLDLSGNTIVRLCTRDYQDCRFDGACILHSSNNEITLINFLKYNVEKDQAYFTKVDLNICQFGYGFGKISATKAGEVCLIPYVSVAADPLKYNLGDVLFIPKLVGLQLPTGAVHDGYVIVSDYSNNDIGTGADHLRFFSGVERTTDSNNSFSKVGLNDPNTEFIMRRATAQESLTTLEKNNFKILHNFKFIFSEGTNSMLEQ